MKGHNKSNKGENKERIKENNHIKEITIDAWKIRIKRLQVIIFLTSLGIIGLSRFFVKRYADQKRSNFYPSLKEDVTPPRNAASSKTNYTTQNPFFLFFGLVTHFLHFYPCSRKIITFFFIILDCFFFLFLIIVLYFVVLCMRWVSPSAYMCACMCVGVSACARTLHMYVHLLKPFTSEGQIYGWTYLYTLCIEHVHMYLWRNVCMY